MPGKAAFAIAAILILTDPSPRLVASEPGHPAILPIRARAEMVKKITRMRLDALLPRLMRETGIDMWIIACDEDVLDPIFETMMPYEIFTPITQILVLYDRGPEKGVERLNISRTDTQGLFVDAWDPPTLDSPKKEGQWECFGRIVKERDPRRIGIDEGEVQWAAGGLTVAVKLKLLQALGPRLAERLVSAEPLSTLWAETLLEEEIEMMERTAAITHAIIAEMFSSAVVTPGHTTTDDLADHFRQAVSDRGLRVSFGPSVKIRGRSPADREKHGKDDRTIRPGDLLHCDVGLKYLRCNSDQQEVAYVLRPGETDVPETFKGHMAEANRLQDVFCGEMRTGLTGNELLRNMLKKARDMGIPDPRIYSHSLGYFLHEPGPLIGLPWEQVKEPGRGDVKLVPMSCFTAELSIGMAVPEWGGQEFRLPIEQDVAFLGDRTVFLDGRQTRFHLIR
jgi:hypothetical protein